MFEQQSLWENFKLAVSALFLFPTTKLMDLQNPLISLATPSSGTSHPVSAAPSTNQLPGGVINSVSAWLHDLTICQLNSRSLVNKLSKFQAFAYSFNYSIICVSETWLSSHIFDNETLPTDYTIYHKDRCSWGGGVLMAIKDKIASSLMTSPPDIEAITVKILTSTPIIMSCLHTT